MTDHAPFISCLCITHRRVPMLRRAVHCFLSQSWQARELLVVHEDVDTDTRDFIAHLAHPQVRTLVVPAQPHVTLGGKRRLSVAAARGEWVATWDDDDWSAPTRLAEEADVLRASGLAAVTLERWIVHDERLGQSWLAQRRPWEASLLGRRDALPPYEDGERGTDRISMAWMAERGMVATLRRPHLYVYLYHGANVGSRVHFKRNIFAQSTPLSAAFSQRIARLLADPRHEAPPSSDELQAALPPGALP
ncbi:MAG: glycosyltransferase family 2 protein [Burkholderiales bacterium]|nr:glycosyltransferase family 2 protein [Burkholderiales bacterium]